MYTEEQMNQILARVEEEFTGLLAKAEEEAAVKAQAETVGEVQDVEKTEETPKQPEEQAPERTEKTEESSYEYDEEDKKEVEKLYASMDKAEADIHYKALKKAMGEKIEPSEDEIEETAKSEQAEQAEEPKQEAEAETEGLKKAEDEIKALKEENETLQKSVQDLTAAMTKYFKAKPAPKRKVTTGLNYIAKSEGEVGKENANVDISGLSKGEISQRLSKKASDPTISAQDREAINEYYLNNGSLDSIRHLLQ